MLTLIVVFILMSVNALLSTDLPQTVSGSFTSAHLHPGTTNARPKPKHPPPKPTIS